MSPMTDDRVLILAHDAATAGLTEILHRAVTKLYAAARYAELLLSGTDLSWK